MSSDYEARLAAEKQARIEKNTDLLMLAGLTAEHLGDGWFVEEPGEKAVEEHNLHLNLKSTKGEIVICRQWDDRGRIRVAPGWPRDRHGHYMIVRVKDDKGDWVNVPDITVAETRGAEQLAREIERRFFPVYLPAYEQSLERVTQTDTMEQQVERLTGELAEIITAEAKSPSHDRVKNQFTKHLGGKENWEHCLARVTGEVSGYNLKEGQPCVTLKIECTPEIAESVLWTVMESLPAPEEEDKPEKTRVEFEVPAERLAWGVQEGEREGDIAASYSADRISEGKPIRKPFKYGSWLYVSTGGSGKGGYNERHAYRLMAADEFNGTPTTYHEKVRGDGGDSARNDPLGFYHGMAVKSGKQTFVMVGPEVVFVPAAAPDAAQTPPPEPTPTPSPEPDDAPGESHGAPGAILTADLNLPAWIVKCGLPDELPADLNELKSIKGIGDYAVNVIRAAIEAVPVEA